MKYADQRSKHCVFGYIRELEKLLPDSNTVELIRQLCLAFYYMRDEWDINCKSDKAEISGNLYRLRGYGYHTSFLKNVCEYPGVYKWRFLIKEWYKGNANWNFVVGIWKEDKKTNYHQVHGACANASKYGIGYVSVAAKMTDPQRVGMYGYNYGKKCKILLNWN